MRQLSIRVLDTLNRRQCTSLSSAISRRAFSRSCVRCEEIKPESEPQRPKGVPLAFDLGGINIPNRRIRRPEPGFRPTRPGPATQLPTVQQRLNARRVERVKAEGGSTPDVAPENGRLREEDATPNPSPAQSIRSQDTAAGPVRRNEGERAGIERRWQASAIKGAGNYPGQAVQREAPATQGARGYQGRNGSRQPIRSYERNGDTRPAGQGQDQGQARGGSAKGSSRKKAKPRSKEGSALRKPKANRISDPDLNDYPFEERNKPPVRNYDGEGMLQLKGYHAQLNPVVRPTLPKYATRPTVSTTEFTAAEQVPVTSTLQVKSYLHRAPPRHATEPSHNVLGVVENAELALSRVRDLDFHQRQDALGIVQKMAGPASNTT